MCFQQTYLWKVVSLHEKHFMSHGKNKAPIRQVRQNNTQGKQLITLGSRFFFQCWPSKLGVELQSLSQLRCSPTPPFLWASWRKQRSLHAQMRCKAVKLDTNSDTSSSKMVLRNESGIKCNLWIFAPRGVAERGPPASVQMSINPLSPPLSPSHKDPSIPSNFWPSATLAICYSRNEESL